MNGLYRIVPYNFETEDEPVFVGGRQMLVKVEPDYEAASRVAMEMKDADYFDSRDIVDAALKGTDR